MCFANGPEGNAHEGEIEDLSSKFGVLGSSNFYFKLPSSFILTFIPSPNFLTFMQ
jgi:hypothetical protein